MHCNLAKDSYKPVKIESTINNMVALNIQNMKQSWLTYKNLTVLFQNKNWSIELSEDKKELHITNGSIVANAYFDRDKQVLRFDHIWCPPYIQKIALKLANKYMISIYSDKLI